MEIGEFNEEYNLHWGAYSQWGIVESWALPDEDHTWAWDDVDKDLTGTEFKQEYHDQIRTFNPVRSV